jgi:nitrite reductase/ring-hydroxylating ferredoxin subunit
MLTVILCIGPLARLDRRFLPLLYNRRHFGVMTFFMALSHAFYILGWYFAFSPTDRYVALLSANTSYGSLLGFPFEAFGIVALLSLAVLALTSHDFWLKFLTPPIWKGLHGLIYVAYVSVIAHVGFGVLQATQTPVFAWVVALCGASVAGLHVLAAWSETRRGDAQTTDHTGTWETVCDVAAVREGGARIARLSNGDRVAVFRQGGRLSAISNACAHQNGPLGEGKLNACLVTCPWHGFEYDITNGCAPAPFTEKVPTYLLRIDGGQVMVDARANPPGTYVEPLPIPGASETEQTA